MAESDTDSKLTPLEQLHSINPQAELKAVSPSYIYSISNNKKGRVDSLEKLHKLEASYGVADSKNALVTLLKNYSPKQEGTEFIAAIADKVLEIEATSYLGRAKVAEIENKNSYDLHPNISKITNAAALLMTIGATTLLDGQGGMLLPIALGLGSSIMILAPSFSKGFIASHRQKTISKAAEHALGEQMLEHIYDLVIAGVPEEARGAKRADFDIIKAHITNKDTLLRSIQEDKHPSTEHLLRASTEKSEASPPPVQTNWTSFTEKTSEEEQKIQR